MVKELVRCSSCALALTLVFWTGFPISVSWGGPKPRKSATQLSTAPCSQTYAFGTAPPERGVALGLFSMNENWSYRGLIDEVADHGATHISLVWVWWQADVQATRIAPKKGWTATETQLLDSIEAAHKRGLHVTVFPIVRLIDPKDGDWRGKIAPKSENDWWLSYDAYILKAAAIARHAQAERLLVGSELLTRESMRGRWQRLIERIRLRHPTLELMYSANWDHYRPVRFWDLVDVIGMTSYWELGPKQDPKLQPLLNAWRGPLNEVRRLAQDLGRPVVLTEVGYPSLTTGLRWPWDETRDADVSLETQRLGYEAVARTFSDQEFVRGIYFWNWFGFGGPKDGDYTPRGKPAAKVLRCWFKGSSIPVSSDESQAKPNPSARTHSSPSPP